MEEEQEEIDVELTTKNYIIHINNELLQIIFGQSDEINKHISQAENLLSELKEILSAVYDLDEQYEIGPNGVPIININGEQE